MSEKLEAFDITSIKPSETVSVEILHPKAKVEIGLRFFLRSIESPEVKKVTRAIQNERIKLGQRGKTFSAEDETANAIKIVVASVAGIEWYTTDDGRHGGFGETLEQLEFTEENVRKLARVDFIRQQIDSELGDTANFYKA